MLHLSSFLFPWGTNIVRLSSPPYSWGNWGTEQPGAPHSAWTETLQHCLGAKGCPHCRGKLTQSNLSEPNPFQPHKANTTTGQHRELESEMKCFLHHPAPSAASLFFVSSVPLKERSTLAGFVSVCVHGWTLPLIVNGAIRPFSLHWGLAKDLTNAVPALKKRIHQGQSFYSLLIYHHLCTHSGGAIVWGCVSFQLQRI